MAAAAAGALGAAALFALAAAMHARALHAVPGSAATGAGRGEMISPVVLTEIRLVSRAFSSRQWVAGTAMAIAGFALHAVALHEGSLTLVQPLLVTVVLFALPAGRLLVGTRVTRLEWSWAILLLVGLMSFFAAADPLSSPRAGVDVGPAVAVSSIGALTVLGCVQLAHRRSGGRAAALLGAAGGIAFAAVAALLKVATNLIGHGVGALLVSWQFYALLAVGAVGIVLSQLAYRAGPLSASLPALNSANPLTSVVIGVAVFDERFRTGIAASAIETVALIIMTAAVIALSRQPRAELTYTTLSSPAPE